MTQHFLRELQDSVSQAVENEGLRPLARRLALPVGVLRSAIDGRNLKVETAFALAQIFGLDFYIGPPRIPSVPEPLEVIPHYGEIGAGGGDMVSDGRIYEATREAPGVTSAPIDTPPQHLTRWGGLVALTVRGRSMEPLFRHGDTLYIYGDDPVASDPERLIGKDCAVVLAGSREGEAYIKRIRRADSGEPGYFNLESLNPMWPVMVDMQLYQARPVRYIRRAI